VKQAAMYYDQIEPLRNLCREVHPMLLEIGPICLLYLASRQFLEQRIRASVLDVVEYAPRIIMAVVKVRNHAVG
jgi:hypothetical protein